MPGRQFAGPFDFYFRRVRFIWRNADNTSNMMGGAALIRNNCEPILKATCHFGRANVEVIFPYYKGNITPSRCGAPTPELQSHM
jgi:hypothetical protein